MAIQHVSGQSKGARKIIVSIYAKIPTFVFAIDHRMWKTGLPVRSAILKPHAGQLVLKWVTIWESWLLIVFGFFFARRLKSVCGAKESLSRR